MTDRVPAKYVSGIPEQEAAQHRAAYRATYQRHIAEYFSRIAATPNRPKAMSYFDGIADFWGSREQELREFKARGGKVVGYTCMFAPLELILAAGAVPLRVDSGFYDAAKLGDRLIPVEVCPVIRSTIGGKMAAFHPYLELCDVVISSNTCDGKTKLGELLSDHLPVWTVNLPCVKDSLHAREYWVTEMREIARKLERLTGTRVTRERLHRAIGTTLRATRAFRRLQEARRGAPVIMGRDYLMAQQMLAFDDMARWTEHAETLAAELEQRQKDKTLVCPEDTPRILLTGSPMFWPDNWKIPNLIEEGNPRGVIVADELCSGDRFMYDPVGVDDGSMKDLFAAIAERYLLPCTCPCFTHEEAGNRDRVDCILTQVKDYRVDGIIYHVIRGCHLYAVEYMRIKKTIEREGIPIYYLDTEYSREDAGQMKTRVEAFLEMLHTRTASVDDLY